MGYKTKIDWCDATWNPVTGCLHGCEYCYARRIAERFGGGCEVAPHYHDVEDSVENVGVIYTHSDKTNHVLDRPYYDAKLGRAVPYPYYFDPTFHRYKLDEPTRWKNPRTIFVCSMADLFGEWVPDEWIAEVFAACKAAPQHRYLFLTKNPHRYIDLAQKGKLPRDSNMWYGSTTTTTDVESFYDLTANTFISIEPIQECFCAMEEVNNPFSALNTTNWIIVGAETGSRKGKVIPRREWITDLRDACAQNHIPLFMKESLRPLMGDDFRQEFPWEVDL